MIQHLIQLFNTQVYPYLFLFRKGLLSVLLGGGFLLVLGISMGWFRSPFRAIHPLEAVPESSALVWETTAALQNLNKMQEADYANELQGLAPSEKWIKSLLKADSLFQRLELSISPLEQGPLVSAAQLQGNNFFDWLHILQVNSRLVYPDKMGTKMGLQLINKTRFHSHFIYQYQDSLGQNITFCRIANLLIWSSNTSFVESAVEQLSRRSDNLLQQADFRSLQKGKGRGEMSIYINFNTLPIFLSLLSPPGSEQFHPLAQSFSRAGLDLRMQQQNFVLTGQIYPKQADGFWNFLSEQRGSSKAELSKLMPENTALCTYFNLSGFDSHYRRRHKELGQPDFDRYILPWLGNEAALLITEPSSKDFSSDKMIILHCKNIDKAKLLLQDYGQTFGQLDSFSYNEFSLQRISANSSLLQSIFGSYFETLKNPYYTFVEDYVVFGHSAAAMELFLERWLRGNTLEQNPAFQPFMGQWRNGSDFFTFINTPNTATLLKSLVRSELHSAIDRRFMQFRNIHPLSIQLSAANGYFQVTISGARNPIREVQKTNLAWRCRLKAKAASPAMILGDSASKIYEIAVQDIDNRFYLIDKGGEIIWQKPLDGRILGQPKTIDFYGNKEFQYALATVKSIYIFARNGDIIKQIPLVSKAIGPLQAIDYGKGLMFFVPCGNAKVYGFDKNGRPLQGWNPNEGLGLVQFPMRYANNSKGEGIFVAANRNGKLTIVQRNGKVKHQNFLGGYFLSDFSIDPNAERIVLGASNGKVHIINFIGKKFALAAPKGFSKETYFVYSDVCGDPRPDFVRMSQKLLSIHYYNEENKIVESLQHLYEQPQDDIFPIRLKGELKSYIGSYSAQSKQISLIDGQGRNYKGFPMEGDSPFSVLDLFQDNNNTLIVTKEAQVLAFKL